MSFGSGFRVVSLFRGRYRDVCLVFLERALFSFSLLFGRFWAYSVFSVFFVDCFTTRFFSYSAFYVFFYG